MDKVEKLADEVGGLRAETSRMHIALDRHTRTMRHRLRWIVVLLAVLTVCGCVVALQLHEQVTATAKATDDQRRLCPLVSLLIPRQGEAPPSTRRGIQMTEAARAYADAIHC